MSDAWKEHLRLYAVPLMDPTPPTMTKYYAIPFIVYVPVDEFETVEVATAAVSDTLNFIGDGIVAFAAEDFDNGIVEKADDQELSAFITTSCLPASGT